MADDRAIRQLSAKEADTLGLPPGYKEFSPFPFAGMNYNDAKYAVQDQEFVWMENIMRESSGFLHSIPGPNATPLYTATGGRTILNFFFFDLGLNSYCAVFFSDGTAVQVDTATLAVTDISTVTGTFYDTTYADTKPACAAWGSKYLLISNNKNTTDYWIWDGAILYTSGTLAPEVTITGTGSGYDGSQPTMTAYGGHGTGATFTATISAGGVVRLVITDPGSGYLPGEFVGVQFDGGGSPDTGVIVTGRLASTTVNVIEVVDGGHGYTAATVAVTGGGGSGCTATAAVSNGRVVSVTVTAAGSSFETAPDVAISGDGVGAKAAAYLLPGRIANATITDAGAGFWLPPVVVAEGGGYLVRGLYECALTATDVNEVRVLDAGDLYTGTANATIDNTGSSGIGLTVSVNMLQGHVRRVNVTAGGGGYIYPPLIYSTGTIATGGRLATFQAYLTPTTVNTAVVSNFGEGYTSAPTVLPDSGFNNAATAVCEVMPFGVSGAAIETFQSRVWLAYPRAKNTTDPSTGGEIVVSAPSSISNFNISDGAVLFSNTNSVLRGRYVAMRQVNGYLYSIGDSSVDVISNVQTSGDPVITTFNAQNIDQEVGTTYRDTVQVFGRTVLFGNQNAIFGIYGGAVTKLSDKFNKLFDVIVTPEDGGVEPSSASSLIHNIKCYLYNCTITDPFTSTERNVMFGWNEKDWFIAYQGSNLTFIGTHIVESDIQAYGTDGSTIFRLFDTPSATLEKVLITKQYGAQNFDILKVAFNVNLHGEDLSSNAAGFECSVVFNCEQVTAALQSADLTLPKPFTEAAADARSYFLGATLGSTSPDFVIYNLSIGYMDEQGPIGSIEGINSPAAS
jgi:hypothetical protein